MPRCSLPSITLRSLHYLLYSIASLVLLAPTANANEIRTTPLASQPAGAHSEADVTAASSGASVASEMSWQSGLAGTLLSSRFAQQHKDVAGSAKFLAESLARDPDNRDLQQQSMRAQVIAGNIDAAVALASRLSEHVPNDPLVATLLMIDAHHRGKFEQARTALEKPQDRGLFGIIRPVLMQWITVSEGGLRAPVDLQASIDKSGFFAPFLYYHAALLNDVLGFSDIARQNYEKASGDNTLTPYRVVEAFANFSARHDNLEGARTLFVNYAKDNPQSNLLPTDDVFAEGSAPPKPLIKNASEGMAELFFSTASILMGEDLTNESFIYLRLALALRADLPPAQLMLANLYESSGEFQQAIDIYNSIAPGTVFYKRALIRRAVNLEALGKTDEAIKELRRLSDQYTTDASPLITLGDMYREKEKYEDAISAYGEALTRMGELQPTDWPLLYARGITYDRAGMWNAAEQDFMNALELEPNQPDVLNYLGYSWLMKSKHQKKARGYIEAALSARPDDPHILDSMGWAYYLAGEYEQAINALEKAVDLMPHDSTVNDHLGDAYFRSGRTTEAQFQWQRALSFDPPPEEAEQIRAKIEHGVPDVNATSAKVKAPESVSSDAR
jgi:tetratricopeptide (TPR) repeat protein